MLIIRNLIVSITILGLLFASIILFAKNDVPKKNYYKDKVIVLLYHDVRKQVPSGGSVSTTISSEQLREHLMMFKDKGFHIIQMEEFVQYMLKGKRIPANAVVLTFDDGYESFYEEVLPILQEFKVTASNFVVGISSDLFDPEAKPHMNWDQMRQLQAKGMGLYNHTYNLHHTVPSDPSGFLKPALTTRKYMEQNGVLETDTQYRKRIFSDITLMQKRLQQELGVRPSLLAFPYGAYDDTVLQEAHRAGIELFFSIEEGMNVKGNRIVKRINAGEPYMTTDALWFHLQSFFDK
ncbi:polysaccharide deacetylase family protein [Paenibacillus qinlingensis]|uniref:polysaccharide deacetylase family protein n=1 Tax=Paenibacillus qinlingensis TaxID=1837343 RepID=UPI001564799B|nr:polysaccharide deacetylase family protein [Paenibacillus qinlingensis]NQX57512.1 polysaccharide deacetylase family protein [Paenibacillus qinlingensis]